MNPFRQLGRHVERFRRIALATAAETVRSESESTADEGPPPHEVIGVSPDAPDPVVRAAARERLKLAHPDQGGSEAEFRRVKRARDQLLEES